MSDNLATWLVQEIRKRHWSARELGRRIGISHTHANRITDITNGTTPSVELCKTIAKVLDVPQEKVLRLAGILDPIPNKDDPTLTEILELVTQLNLEERLEVLEYAMFRYQREQEQRERAATDQSAVADVLVQARAKAQ